MRPRSHLFLGPVLVLCAACGAPRTATPATPSTVAPPPLAVAAPAPPPTLEVPGCPPPATSDPPIRFGAEEMVPLCRDVYVEPALTREERERVARLYAASLEDVARSFGPLESRAPLAILCKTPACGAYLVGVHARSMVIGPGQRAFGATYVAGDRPTIAIVRIDEPARGVLAHERAHVETATRLRGAHVPAWFDEGLAAVASGEPDCSREDPRGIDDLRRLEWNWDEYTNEPQTITATYCQARAEVDAWLHGSADARPAGNARVLDLLDRVRDGAAFEDVYGPMRTQAKGPVPTVVVSSARRLGDPRWPFSLTMWIKPTARGGVLAHVSTTPVGTGWCGPFLGYDHDGHLVSQLFHGDSPALSSFAVAVDPKVRPLGRWTHVAMTWAPGSPSRLYVNGERAAEAPAPRYNAARESPVYVAWGSNNLGGARCWEGAIPPGAFQGAVTAMRVHEAELSPAEVAALARVPP